MTNIQTNNLTPSSRESKIAELLLLREKRRRQWKSRYDWWVDDNWTSRGERLDLGFGKDTKRPYLKLIYQDQAPEIYYKKSAQVGVTERMLTEAIWLPDQFKENALYIFPTSGTMSDLVQERVDEPFNNSEYLSGLSAITKTKYAKWANKVGLKRLSQGFVYFRGSNKPTQITSVSADLAILDEVDRILPESIPYAEKRLKNSKRAWIRCGSTPTIPSFGIDKMFEETDQREWNVKCQKCNEWQPIDFVQNVDQDRAVIICRKCKNELVPWECPGEWVAKNRGAEKRGYFITQLYSPLVNLKKLIKLSKSSNEFELQQFYNQDLGMAYEPKGSKINELMIGACKREYSIPAKEEDCYIGIDVGKILHAVVRGGKRVLDIRELDDFCGAGNTAEMLIKQYEPKCVVIDALPETRKAQELQTKFTSRIWLCYYAGMTEIKTDKETGETDWFKADEGKINTDRTVSLDYSLGEIISQQIELPKNIDSYQNFKEQLKALVRTIRDVRGRKVAEYVQTGPDHFAHANNYAKLAKELFAKMAPVEPDIMIF